MRTCNLCGFRADLYCLDCHQFWCFQHVVVLRDAWGYRCQVSADNHAFVPIIQEESENPLKATNPDMARKEGRKFATLLGKVFVKQPDQDFESVSELAQYLSIDVMGYRDAEIANAYVRGFVAAMTASQTPDELSEQYAQGQISLDMLTRAIQKAIQAPRPAPSETVEGD